MKKILLLLALFATVFVVSCDENNVGGGNTSAKPTTPEEHKKRLEEITIGLIDEVAATNFEEISDLATYLYSEYSEDKYDYEEIEDWADECYAALARTFIGEECDSSEWYKETYMYYNTVVKASNFTGKFVAKNGKWKYTEANDLSFHVTDDKGNPCVFRLTTSGNTKKVFFGENWQYTEYDNENGKYIYSYDVDNIYVHVPEKITVVLEQGGKSLAKANVKIDLSSITGENLNLSKDKYNVTGEFEFNGYSVALEKCKYAPEAGSAVAINFKKGSNSLIKASISADLDVSNENFYGSTNNILDIDVMGELQIKGAIIGDVTEIEKQLDAAYENDTNEKLFKKAIENINNLFDVKLYYNNSKTASATLKLMPFIDDRSYEELYWDYELAIVFDDETSYSIEEFFNEKDFKNVTKAFERLIEDYIDLIEAVDGEDIEESEDYYDDEYYY
ncbi:MAG: hypothetical protein J6U58_04490 [Bacteroidaceae bacterium]|nr:hypothetical protein [Bacteroidaceae bacterium]